MHAVTVPAIKRSSRGRGPWMTIGYSLLAAAIVITTAVSSLAGDPAARPTEPAAASSPPAQPEQAGPQATLAATGRMTSIPADVTSPTGWNGAVKRWGDSTGNPTVTGGASTGGGPATVAPPAVTPPTVTPPTVATAPPTAAPAPPGAAPPTDVVTPSPIPTPPSLTPTPSPQSVPAPPPPTVACGSPAGRDVSTAEQLRAALAQAQPGTVIHLRDGTYPGHFEITTAATADQPITLCGSRAAILDGGPIDSGYTLHLRSASHWQLSGFTIRGGQKGLMVDSTRGALIDGLLVHEVGDEAVHLRTASSDNTVRATTIRRTGLRVAKFGEGIYIGSARSNWCTYSNCEPDRSDHNLIHGNDIADTTSEAIDIKEGTSNGVLRANTFSGAAMTAADSWVDVKGNGWTITDNVGTDAPADGFQTHAILDGWGERNTFHNNAATVNARGYAINITRRHLGNVVSCTNRATNASAGLSTIPCQ